MSKTVGACIIAKNEEALIARCLESIKNADQIVVVDTGSRDRTIEIARQFGAEVHVDYIWDDDFASCQNHAKSKMKTDWIISVDCDEFVHDFSEVRRAIELAKDMVRVTMVAEGGGRLEFGFGRLFRNSPDIYWVQPIHKHLNIPGEGEQIGNVKITFGWSPAHANDPDRSLRILERVVEQEGESARRNLYYLGREYWYKKRYKECTKTLGRYVQISIWPAEKAESFLVMSQAYSAQGFDEDARDAILQAIKINSNFKEAIQWMASISTPENAKQWQRMAKTANNRDIMWDRVPAEPIRDVIFLSPYPCVESMFAAYTLMRLRPLVIVVCDGDTNGTVAAMKLIGCPVLFMNISQLTETVLKERLEGFTPETIYAPAVQDIDPRMDLVGKVAFEMFGSRCERYTNGKTDTSKWEVVPTHSETEIKNKMLDCFGIKNYCIESEWLV